MFDSRMSLRKWLETQGSLIEAIEALNPFPFITDAKQLEYMLLLNYGQRTVFTPMEGVDVNDMAAQIILAYKDKWDKVFDLSNSLGNIGATQSRKIGGKVTTNKTEKADGETINSTAAFNSPDMMKDNAVDFNNEKTTTTEVINDGTDETISLKAAFTNLPLLEQTNIINVVLKDVANYITVSVY